MTNKIPHTPSMQMLILLADDNPINREMVKRILENYDFKVVTASNGEEALEQIFQQNNFDLILLDINMPKISGIEVATIIRKSLNNEIKKIPIVALTGNESREEINEIFSCGINSYIAKPATPARLIEVINQTIKNPDQSNISRNTDSPNDWNLESHFSKACQEEIDIKKGTFYVGNDPAIFKKLLLRFLNNYEDCIVKIKEIIDSNDHEKAVFAVHNLKGTSAQICAFRFHAIVKKFEEKIQDSLNEINNEDIKRLESSFLRVVNSIRTILEIDTIDNSRVNKNKDTNCGPEEKKTIIESVIKALETGKVKKIEENINRLEAYIETGQEKEIFLQLKELTEKYDFKNAFLKAKTLFSIL